MDLPQNPGIRSLLKRARTVAVTCHVNPDGDAMAALIALSLSLRMARWGVRAVCPSPVPASYRFLPGWESVLVPPAGPAGRCDESEAGRALLDADAIICLDCSDLSRLGALPALCPTAFDRATIVNIDHHVGNSQFGTLNLVDPTAGSVCELLAALMEREDLPVTAEIATALLVGIVSDTLGFRTPATSAQTLRMAADLMERGASLARINELIFNTRSPRALRLWGEVLTRARMEDGFVYADITGEMLDRCGASLEDADMLVDFIAGVPETWGAFLFSEHEGKVRVSIRTSGTLDAAALARAFGGGGHVRAAGCTLEMTLDKAHNSLLGEARRRVSVAATGSEEPYLPTP